MHKGRPPPKPPRLPLATAAKTSILAVMMADALANGRADPAFDAHKVPIATWALALWEAWLPTNVLEQRMDAAITTLNNAKTTRSEVKGPAAAMVATAAGIGWQTIISTTLITDLGDVLDLHLDPPPR